VGLVLVGTVAWGLYSFILPIVFTWIGQVLGAIAAAVLVIAFFILLPVILKALKRLARFLHKLLIKYDPFGELEEQKQKMQQNRVEFKQAKAKIKAIKSNMEQESIKAEKESKEYQEKVLTLQARAESTKNKMQEIEQKVGETAAKDSDEYVELQTGIMKTLSEAQRVGHLLNQSTGLVRKYGSRRHAEKRICFCRGRQTSDRTGQICYVVYKRLGTGICPGCCYQYDCTRSCYNQGEPA
jgi:methyl-accepting chemotaxis protein